VCYLCPYCIRTLRSATIGWAVKEHLDGNFPSKSKIWISLQDKDIGLCGKQFFWKTIKNAYFIGEKWDNVPNCEHCSHCPLCNRTESMEHILTNTEDCPNRESHILWDLAKFFWLQHYPNWPDLSIGTILGCALEKFNGNDPAQVQGTERLYRILISGTAHMVWKLHCERRIEHQDIAEQTSAKEIAHRWHYKINARFKVDRALTHVHLHGACAIAKELVLNTWRGTILNNSDNTEDWLYTSANAT